MVSLTCHAVNADARTSSFNSPPDRRTKLGDIRQGEAQSNCHIRAALPTERPHRLSSAAAVFRAVPSARLTPYRGPHSAHCTQHRTTLVRRPVIPHGGLGGARHPAQLRAATRASGYAGTPPPGTPRAGRVRFGGLPRDRGQPLASSRFPQPKGTHRARGRGPGEGSPNAGTWALSRRLRHSEEAAPHRDSAARGGRTLPPHPSPPIG